MTKINPLGKLLLVRQMEQEESTTATGIVIPGTAKEEQLRKGTVVKVGQGERSNFNGELYPVDTIKEGMIVYYSPNHATEITDPVNSQKFYFVNSGMLFGYESLEDESE